MAQMAFGDRFGFPFAAMLLALQKRDKSDPTIYNGLSAVFTDKELDVSNVKYDLRSEKMAELKQFRELMEGTKSDRPESLTTQSLSAFEKLTIDDAFSNRVRQSGGQYMEGGC
ncbi:hypothetical protein ACHAPU_010498 [Fusarium lateritium]